VKEDQKTTLQQENMPISGQDTPAHLTFRRIVVHDFSTEPDPEPLRFYYRGHRKHLADRSAA